MFSIRYTIVFMFNYQVELIIRHMVVLLSDKASVDLN